MYYTMKKKIIISIITIVICLMMFIPSFVFAGTGTSGASTTDLNSIYQTSNGGFGDDKLQTRTGNILGLIQVIGYVTAIAMAVVMGIRYILAAPEGKADLKKTMVPYIIGCIILTAGTLIVSAVSAFAKGSISV